MPPKTGTPSKDPLHKALAATVTTNKTPSKSQTPSKTKPTTTTKKSTASTKQSMNDEFDDDSMDEEGIAAMFDDEIVPTKSTKSSSTTTKTVTKSTPSTPSKSITKSTPSKSTQSTTTPSKSTSTTSTVTPKSTTTTTPSKSTKSSKSTIMTDDVQQQVPSTTTTTKSKTLMQNIFAQVKNKPQLKKELNSLKKRLGSTKFIRTIQLMKQKGVMSGNQIHNAPNRTKKAIEKSKKYVEAREKYIQLRAKPHKKGGVVYLGHIPQDFTEKSIRRFFKQYGEVKRLHVARSKKTGKTKGYAFIEFTSPEVAAIVADSMDQYMFGGRVLQAQYIPYEQLHSETFRNTYRAFLPLNFTNMHNDTVNKQRTEGQVLNMQKKQISKLSKQEAKLAQYGLSVDDVAVAVQDTVYLAATPAVKAIEEQRKSKQQKVTQNVPKQQQKVVQLPKSQPKSTTPIKSTTSTPTTTKVQSKSIEQTVEDNKKATKTRKAVEQEPIVEVEVKKVEATPVKKVGRPTTRKQVEEPKEVVEEPIITAQIIEDKPKRGRPSTKQPIIQQQQEEEEEQKAPEPKITTRGRAKKAVVEDKVEIQQEQIIEEQPKRRGRPPKK